MTRAAARLRLSQQALSMSMRALERELGVPLLDRSRRGVALLASGEALYADAVPLLAAATAAIGRARRADRGEPELLRIGHTPAVTGIEVTEMLAGAPAHGASVQVVALPVRRAQRAPARPVRRHRSEPGDGAGGRAGRAGRGPPPSAAGRAGRAPARPPSRGHPAGARRGDPDRRRTARRLRLHRPPARPVPARRSRRWPREDGRRPPAPTSRVRPVPRPRTTRRTRRLRSRPPARQPCPTPMPPYPPGSQEIIASVPVLRHQRGARLRRSAHCVASRGLRGQVVLVIAQGGVVASSPDVA